MVTVSIKEAFRRYKPTIGFHKGKLVAELSNELPWRIVEITPDKFEFELCPIEHKDGVATIKTSAGDVYSVSNDLFEDKTHLANTDAIISCQPEEEAIYQELATAGLLPENFMAELKKNGKATYGVMCPWNPPEGIEEFKEFFMKSYFHSQGLSFKLK